ncbi:MAG: arginine--tRNA ligase [Candidatus Methanomethylicota archaeon]|uniref:Arginine--tRNA ligase n=1 Tax=Thermoproteota archaeon TaxID=2056631 RepID=A0A497F0V2_9CREN|nr:MAG: arginine--tRNA ligase [Candidatus Verstraetearchaeota archaeon]
MYIFLLEHPRSSFIEGVYILINPYGIFKEECISLLSTSFKKLYGVEARDFELKPPPSPVMGVLGCPVFEIARLLNKDPTTVASEIAEDINSAEKRFVAKAESAGTGYVNFHLDYPKFSKFVLENVLRLGEDYGKLNLGNGIKVIVEHTSVNPVHPIHIGGARNAIIGDCISRILSSTGYQVERHFYIDDVGLQVAQAAYGFSKLEDHAPDVKPDHFIGFVYAVTNCIVSINSLKKDIERLKACGDEEGVKSKLRELDEWMSIAAELRSKNQEVFDKLATAISKDVDPNKSINELMRRYEEGDLRAVKVVRKVCEMSISGFKQTLERVGVEFDSWDWESEITIWSGLVDEVISKLSETPFVFQDKGALMLNTEYIAQTYSLKEKFNIRDEVPPLTLKRSDGTTLYTTRDIAYTLWKFSQAEKVINVISIEQKLPQLQLKLALYALGKGELADKLVHFGYELVSLPGYKMSGRRGRYVSFDQVLDEAVYRAYIEVSKRTPSLSEEEKKKIAEDVGVAAVRYALISISPLKPLTFTWERVLDFERNSGPFIQYAYARAHNILAKSDISPKPDVNINLLNDDLEKALILRVAYFPEAVARAAIELRPELIAEYANDLAMTFNLFYDKLPVLTANPNELKEARLALVKAVEITLKNALKLLGIKALPRM